MDDVDTPPAASALGASDERSRVTERGARDTGDPPRQQIDLPLALRLIELKKAACVYVTGGASPSRWLCFTQEALSVGTHDL